jgi:hypothetical protein
MSALTDGRLVTQCNGVLDENLVLNTINVQGHFADGVVGFWVGTTDAIVSLLDSELDHRSNHVSQCWFMACPQKWQRQHIIDSVALVSAKVRMHLWRDNSLEETVADMAVSLQLGPHWTASDRQHRGCQQAWHLSTTDLH